MNQLYSNNSKQLKKLRCFEIVKDNSSERLEALRRLMVCTGQQRQRTDMFMDFSLKCTHLFQALSTLNMHQHLLQTPKRLLVFASIACTLAAATTTLLCKHAFKLHVLFKTFLPHLSDTLSYYHSPLSHKFCRS